jgi:hypothetical protein
MTYYILVNKTQKVFIGTNRPTPTKSKATKFASEKKAKLALATIGKMFNMDTTLYKVEKIEK